MSTLEIELSPELEQRLDDEARQRGQTTAEVARTLLEQRLGVVDRQTQRERNQAAIALLRSWLEEDPPEGPDPDPPVQITPLSLREVTIGD